MPFVTQWNHPNPSELNIKRALDPRAWSFKTWTLEIREEYAVEDSCFWLSKWSLIADIER